MTNFTDLELDPKVLQAIAEAGYETPTPIQAQAIPHALQGRDVLGIAQTGTGKTASFVLPMLTMLAKGRARARMPRSLVLCPTRELAAQVAENFETYSKHIKLSMALLIGGVSFKDQDRLIDRGVDVLIATPGRLLDHFERGKLMLTGVQIMVVDEADRMLDMGFIPDIERIFKLTPFTRQTLFFSATMAPEITRITQEFLSNPVRVEVAAQATTSETIDQYVCIHKPARRDTSDKEKRDVLRRLIRAEGDALTNGIIFCNRKRDVDLVAKSLKKHGFDAEPIHGDLDQSVRTRTLEGFRDGNIRLLIASDVAARGLDIPSVSHVFNFDVPTHSEDYVHRIGRTGRAGRTGKSITLCLPSEEKYLGQIEELVKKPIPRLASPLTNEATMIAADPDLDTERPRRERRPRNPARNRSEQPSAPASERNEDAAPKPVEAPRPVSEQRTNRDAQQSQDRPRHRPQQRDKGQRVLGLGDHVPAFMMLDLRAGLAAFDVNTADDDGDEVPLKTDADIEEIAETAPVREKPARKPRARKPARSAAIVSPAESGEATPVEAVTEVNVTEPASEPASEATPAAPKRKPRVRKSSKPEAVVVEVPADQAKAEEKPKPKPRTRKPAVKKTDDATN